MIIEAIYKSSVRLHRQYWMLYHCGWECQPVSLHSELDPSRNLVEPLAVYGEHIRTKLTYTPSYVVYPPVPKWHQDRSAEPREQPIGFEISNTCGNSTEPFRRVWSLIVLLSSRITFWHPVDEMVLPMLWVEDWQNLCPLAAGYIKWACSPPPSIITSPFR